MDSNRSAIYELQKNNIHTIKDNDAYQRMNYLYQASFLLQNSTLQQYMYQQCKEVGEKKVIRMTSQIKRTHCKKCGQLLIDFNTKKNNNKLMIYMKCQQGHLNKKFVK
ncbi:Ribonuclease P protein subunit p21 [Paramecium bursaria]